MSLFYVTNITLDIIWGVTCWVLKKTRKGVNTFLYPKNAPLITEGRRLLQLEECNRNQAGDIVILRQKIEVINDYLLKQKLIEC